MLKQFLDRVRPQKHLPETLAYDDAVDILESQSIRQRKALALRADAAPEMLYYLAKDTSEDVRIAVAANTSTPLQADHILASDISEEVRCELARKISRLVPGIQSDETSKLLDQAVGVLETLANDQIARIRGIVAEELRSETNVPKRIVKKLACDVELIVSVPILEYSPLLGDDDLIEIIASGSASEALSAISRRSEVSGDVSQAIVSTLDIPAVASLLVNENAQIREETLDQIIDNAQSIEAWHQPLVMRPDLSNRAAKRIAGFVASSLITCLCERNNLDEDVVRDLKLRVRERIDEEDSLQDDPKALEDKAREAARAAYRNGELTDEFIQALADTNKFDDIVASLSELAKLPHSVVHRVLKSRHGKVICALAWKAGLSMRTAFLLQTGPAHVPPPQLIMAKDGTDYPLSAEEMEWQLDYFIRQKK